MGATTAKVDVLIAPFSYDSYAEGLQRLLTKVENFNVVRTDVVNVQQRLANKKSDTTTTTVVILEMGAASSEELMADSSRSATLVLLDPSGQQVSVRIENPDSDQLIRIIRAAAIGAPEQEQASTSWIRVLGPNDFTHPRCPRQSERFDSVTEWLDLTLALALLELRDKQAQRSIAGWYVSPVSALILLGIDPDNDSTTSVAQRLADLEKDFLTDKSTMPSSVEALVTRFELADVEMRVLLLCLATELDGRYGVAFGVLQDDMTRRLPTLTLLAQLTNHSDLAWELRSRLTSQGSLLSNGLIEKAVPGSTSAVVDEGLKVSDSIVQHFLCQDPNLVVKANGAQLLNPLRHPLTVAEQDLANRLEVLADAENGCPTLNPVGQHLGWFERAVNHAGITMIRGDLSTAKGQNPSVKIRGWLLLCQLYGTGLFIEGLDVLDAKERRSVVAEIDMAALRPGFVAFAGDQSMWTNSNSSVLRLQSPITTSVERSELWKQETQSVGLKLTGEDARYLAATLPIDLAEMKACIALCLQADNSDTARQQSRPLVRRLQQAFRDQNRVPLPPAVRRVETSFDWDDLVVPDSVMKPLRTMAAHVAQAGRVFEEWGFEGRMPYGHGLSALFSGPSGTGKTMAARVIAAELGVELLQVDLSKTVSKYIGETEKNLDAAFGAAEKVGAMLLFDEADALFGKRTEVKDSHDRHANVEVAYLLQRIESFPGLAILTTNLKQNIDHAFLRRLRFSVDFPVPNASERESIWHRSFPEAAPLADELDLSYLARHLKLTGGSIQQISLHAAFAASADETNIEMGHIVAATRQELVKVGMLNAEKTLEGLAA